MRGTLVVKGLTLKKTYEFGYSYLSDRQFLQTDLREFDKFDELAQVKLSHKIMFKQGVATLLPIILMNIERIKQYKDNFQYEL